MAASLLEDNLRTLHKSLTGASAQKEQSNGIVSDLRQICVQEISDKEIDYTCSCLFDREYGLVSFLSKAVTNEEFLACKTKVLELLCLFVERVGKKALPYAIDIKDVCVSLFSRDRSAKVKNAAMPLLIRLLEITVGLSLGKDLQIDKLITKFFNELTKSASKLAPSVRENIYILLGVIAEVYPEYMTQYSDKLKDIYLAALRTEMNNKTRKPELAVIAGCVEGLCSSLVHFTESADEGSRRSYEIFKFARSTIDPNVDFTRYNVPKAGLKLFARHASQFSQYLIEDYENIYGKMSFWSHHKNSEMVGLGMRAIESFLKQISEMLKQKARDGKQEGKGIFKYFVQQFQDIMHKESANSKELSLAIRGYGLLAGPCKCYLKEEDVQFMFTEMLTKTEQQFLGQAEDLENKLYNLASYLESLASIVREMDELSETYALSLEHLMVLLLENIPNIHPSKHFLCHRAILWLLLAIMPKGTAFRQVLAGFVFQSLIRTCSYLPVVDTENEGEATPEDLNVKKITYKDFMETWQGLLDAPLIKEFSAADVSLEVRHKLTDALYNEIMTAILKILHKLDLTSAADDAQSAVASTSASGDAGVSSADPLLGVQPKRPKDFQVFINLVDFCRDLLTVKHPAKFETWVFTLTHQLILLSTDNPLASGFYKLLSVSMKLANKLNYFQDLSISATFDDVKQEASDDIKQEPSDDVKQEPMEVDIPSRRVGPSNKFTCYLLVSKFSKEVLVRMKQYRDDLLASCLTFILSLPKEVISEHLQEVVPAIQVTLNLGLSYLPLAMVAMDALEFWMKSLPADVMLQFYPSILPCLDSFLKTTDLGADDVNVETNVSTDKNKSGKGRKKLSVRLIRGKKDASPRSYRSQLTGVKERMVRYLGQLGGSVNAGLLSQVDKEVAHKAIAWDSKQHLKFDMPFVDMKPTIYLDPFLPHVVDLATKSSDRQTKVAACELLHSLLLYSIGRGAQQPGARVERASMAGLYYNIFPAMLKLACDVEQVAKQLFEPLTMQIIHWFTNSKKAESEETMTLLDAIYDAMIQQSDTALRDFAARCLQEFLKWSIKQSSAKASEKNPANAKSVLKRLYSYALHPGAFKRLGAALAFNNIYSVFREEEPLVDMFTFELLVHFVESLAIAHTDEKSLGTQEQSSKALEHLEKIIRHKAAILKGPSKNRKEPKNWTSITLDIAVRWLTRQCGRPQTECRHACMKLSYKLCTLLGGIKTPVSFFQACLKGKGPDYWIQRFEGGGQTGRVKHGLERAATLVECADVFSLQATLAWFDDVLAALDCYTWVFGENLLSPGDVFGKKAAQSHVFTSVEYILKNVVMVDIAGVAKLFSTRTEVDLFTPKETDDFNRAKCTVIVRLLSFLTVMLAKYKKETIAVVPKAIFGPELWELMCCCVVQPGDVGFNMGDVEIMKNLPQEMSQMLAVFSRSFGTEMKKHFKQSLSGERNLFGQLPLPLNEAASDQVHIQQILSGYVQLHEVNLLLPCLPDNNAAQQLLTNVFQGIVTDSGDGLSTVTLTPTGLTVAKTMLKLAFSLGIPPQQVVERLLDQKRVSSGASKTLDQMHGDLFFSLFKSAVSQQCVNTIEDLVPALVPHIDGEPRRVGAVLVAAVDFLSRDRELRKKQGEKVLTTILSHWPQFSGWWGKTASSDLQGMAVLLFTKLLLIDSKFASATDHKSFDHVFNMYQTMLTDSKTNLAFKCRVLDLLPFFANIPQPQSAKLKSSLDRLAADAFPLRSSELVKGSQKYQDYLSALDRILGAFQLSGSLMLLEYLISLFCREREHVHEDAIQKAIAKFITKLPRDKQKAALDVPYNIFVKLGFPSEIRRATIERVCLPMLRLVNKSALLDFYTDHISQIKDFIDAKLNKSNEGVLEGQLVSRIGCFQLLELMYSRLPKDDLVGLPSVINKAFCNAKVDTGKELTSFVSRQAHDAKGEDIRGETILLSLRRQYHCAAYNLMVAFIICTQKELKYYTAFLFEEKEAKGQFLLENIIDKDHLYEFPVELVSLMERKKRFVAIHAEVIYDRRHGGGDEDDSYDDMSPSVHLASQYLADSSLSEDVSQYFSMSGTVGSVTGSIGRKKISSRAQRKSADELDVDVTVGGDYVELEMDELNQHECMATMIAVIKHMHDNKITPEVPAGTVNPVLPSWMEKLHTKMCNARTHHNVKLFIAKLIVNTAEIFKPYASHWLRPLCQLIVSGPLGSGSITYYLTDLIVTLLSWHKHAIPQDTVEEKAMASRLVHFVVKNIFHDTRPVFRNNLEMLKTLLQCWKSRVEIPYQEVYAQLCSADPKTKDSGVGVQVLGVVLACKFPPYGPVAPVDREKFFSKVANGMGNTHKTIYAPAAEVCGLIFRYLADREDEKEGTFHEYVSNLMTQLHQGRPDNFITSVHRMQKHYPPIADRFLNKLLFMLPNLHGEFRTLCLEVLHARIEQVENVFLELKSKGLMASLSHRDEGTQLVSLKIVKAVSTKLKASELNFFMPVITGFISNPSTSCRTVMYEILMWVYDNYRDVDSEESNAIIQMTKECLLRGLGDDDLHCRLQVQNFWSSATRLPGGTLDRLVSMLEAMYVPVTEQQYLSYATNLLLEMTSKSPDYQREIFELPLSECKFSDYSVKSSWRQRHAAMTPLFATQASQSMIEDEDGVDGVRATQDVQQFTQTVEPGTQRGPFNWLTQSSLDTFADVSVVPMDTQTSSSSLLFSIGTGDSQGQSSRRSKYRPGQGKQRISTPQAAISTTKKEEKDDDNELFRLRRRFLRDQEQSRIFFAKRQTRMKQMRETALREQKTRRENQVTMYRKYRSGDLPDIQIKYSYIIAPLQALAHRDSTIAKLLFSAIFQAIFARRDEVKTDREIGEVVEQINTSMDNILSQSTQYFSPFIGCVLDILYALRKQLKIDVANIGGSSIFSNLQPLGIVVLEEQLIIQENMEPRAAKRARKEEPVSKDVAHWIELSRLYKSVEEYDVLMGIFSGKLGTKYITQQAVEAESRGDYYAAKKLYDEALNETNWKDSNPLEVEKDLWEDCRMECLSNLSQWGLLEEASTEAVDGAKPPNLCKVWEDTYLQEHFLPFILKSKLKLMLQGDESQQSLLNFVDRCMLVPEQKLVLENRYSQELALMYLWQEDYARARHYANMAINCFLQEWSSTDSLMVSSRITALQTLQPLTELMEFLQFMEDEKNFHSPDPANALVKEWDKRTPHLLTDPVTIWDDVVTNRTVYLDHISGRLQKLDDSQDSIESDDLFMDTKLRLKLHMADSCTQQNNYTMALRMMKETHSLCKRYGLLCEWTHQYTSTHQKKIRTTLESWSEEAVNNVVTTLDQLGKIADSEALTAVPGKARRHHVLCGQGYELLALGLQGVTVNPGSRLEEKLLQLSGMAKIQKQELTEQLIVDGYEKLKASLSVEDRPRVKGRASCGPWGQYGQDEAYLATAKYCDTIMRLKEEEELQIGGSCVKSFPETLVVCMLKAMKLGSEEATQRFPRLLQVVEQHPDTMATFILKSAEVPCWMFILWISQMLAVLDKKESMAIHGILERITRLYPQAVIYPLKLSQEGYKFGKSKEDKVNEAMVERLKALTSSERMPLVAKFMSALECFGQPDQEVTDVFNELYKLLKKGNKSKVRELYNDLYWRILNYKVREREESKGASKSQTSQRSSSGADTSMGDDESLYVSESVLDIGSYARKFADIRAEIKVRHLIDCHIHQNDEKFKAEFDKKFGLEGKKLPDMSAKEFHNARAYLMGMFEVEVKGTKGSLKPPPKLAEYSKWMANFNPSIYGRGLELPGQYTGLRKPQPEYHVKVAGFDKDVMVMSSLRKPKRIIIRGNDERDYKFLVKGGEDLRQDQRIEQLFYVMNQVFRNDPACSHRKLELKTYQVIPITTRVGLIEWMDNTKPLKDFLVDSLTDEEKNFFRSDHGPNATHMRWVCKHSKPKDNNGVKYANVYSKYTLTETAHQLNNTESKVPWDLFRRSFQKLSTSPEAFHVLRSHCMQTHAMLSICQYILGIGDRHLSNFMVNMKTGEMVGIDFGHAFGSATQFLGVPELVPFRLTRQFRNLMLPLQLKGLIENTMIHVLRALRSDSDLLLATLDIFVKEPSLDWLQNAERQEQSMADEDAELYSQEGAMIEWYPKQKIHYVKRKLHGANPAYITRDELRLGHGKKDAFKYFEKVVLGSDDRARHKLPAQDLSAEQQVEALIDQASDPNILGRTWLGWEPWV